MEKTIFFVANIYLSVHLSGCSATGTAFQLDNAVSSIKGVVYIFRQPIAVSEFLVPLLLDNDKSIGKIKNGQFIRYETSPGTHIFQTDTIAIDMPLTLDVKAGEVYYLRLGTRQGKWRKIWYLSRVYPSEAVKELEDCCKDGT